MESKLSTNVADLSEDQRKLLESLIGQPLDAEEVVYWVVMRPGRTPTAADKARARAGMQELIAKADRHAQEQGTTAEEYGAAVDEAVRHVRSQSDE
jgi:hypothetical protein